MKNYFFKIIILIALFSFQKNILFAQDTLGSWTLFGVGKFNPTIADANKINENPVVNDSTQKLPVKGYNINSKKINTGFDVVPIIPAQMIGEPLTKLYNGLVKLGFGN